MFSTNTNDFKPNSNNNNNNNNLIKDEPGNMENNIDRSTAALTALTIQEDTQNNEASNNVSCSNSTDATIESYEVDNVRYGKCKWFNVAKGWGFITPNDGGQEVFVHQSVIQMSGFRSLGEQEDVEFECHLTERGLEATRVSGRQGTDCHGSTFRPRTKKRHRRVRCYNCGEFANHIASKCHLGPQPKRCHLCKQSDHLFANCPTKKDQKNTSLQHSIDSTDGANLQEGQETFNETS